MFGKRLLISLISLFIITVSAQGQDAGDLLNQMQGAGLKLEDIDQLLKANMSGQLPAMTLPDMEQFESLMPEQTSSRDSVIRKGISADILLGNPKLLEKTLYDRFEREGKYRNIINRGNLSQSQIDSLEVYEPDKFYDYEIVIKEGKYVLRRLPLVFGREVFTNPMLSFNPNINMATPVGYKLGAGDELIVEIWGNSEIYLSQKITPDGTINIEGIGPVTVGGYSVDEAQKRVASRVANIMEGAQTKLSVGQIRTINVNITGEVMVPGTYAISSLATVFNAMYMAGGVNSIGSLRDIRIYRSNEEVARLDIYDYLINGNYGANIHLQDNDMIIVPPYNNYVTMAGKIKRERIYELKEGETLSDAIRFAGGFTGDAYSNSINVKRKTGSRYRIFTVDEENFAGFVMNDGDSVAVDKIIEEYANMIAIKGAVWRPGEYEYSESISSLSKLIEKAEGLKGDEFASRGQITRRKKDYTYEMIPFDLSAVFNGNDIELQPDDEVYIPSILELREFYTVTSKGELNAPATFSFREGMTVEDVIVLSGGFRESASYARIDVARRVKDPNSTEYNSKTADIFTFNVTGDLRVAPEAGRFVLHPFDEIIVRRSPGYSELQTIVVVGEVLHTGNYVLATAGERLSDVISKAGGFTPEAYVRGASVKRQLTDDEKARIESMLAIARNNGGGVSPVQPDLNASYPIGVDVERAVKNPGCSDDIILRDGDQVFVPKMNSTVKISGHILYPNTVAYESSSLRSYINQGGGYNYNSRRRPYVVYMNGKVTATRGAFLFKSLPKVEPGCEIVVPVKPERTGRGMAAAMGMMSSTTSMMAMIASILNLSK